VLFALLVDQALSKVLEDQTEHVILLKLFRRTKDLSKDKLTTETPFCTLDTIS
jgi:hypothetical protein